MKVFSMSVFFFFFFGCIICVAIYTCDCGVLFLIHILDLIYDNFVAGEGSVRDKWSHRVKWVLRGQEEKQQVRKMGYMIELSTEAEY